MATYDHLNNLKSPQNVEGGVAEKILLAPVEWFQTIQLPVAPFTNPGDEITIKTAHTFKLIDVGGTDTYGFMVATLAPQKNKLGSKSVGDIGLLRQMSEVDVFLPGSYGALHSVVKHLKNRPLVALIKDANTDSNLYYQLGGVDFNAWVSESTFDTGTTKDGNKGYSLKLSYDGALYIYNVTEAPVLLPD